MKLLLTQVIILGLAQSAKNSPKSRVESVSDHKEFKKVLRTKNNVLTLFINNQKKSGELAKTLDEVSVEVKGLATILTVDCNDKDGKKLCKKLKISAEPAHVIKHFKDGDFHKDYDRALKSKSLVTFLKDPAGELPWEEDPAAQDVAHIANPKQFSALLKSEKGPVLTMFYAPWCGHCKVRSNIIQLPAHFLITKQNSENEAGLPGSSQRDEGQGRAGRHGRQQAGEQPSEQEVQHHRLPHPPLLPGRGTSISVSGWKQQGGP